MRSALRMAGVDGREVDHVNAHATGTPVGDVGEAAAIARAVGTGAAVSAPKSAIGHLFGAAGAVETILALRAVETGVVPPTLNLDRLDPAVDLDVVAGTARRSPVRVALSNSFGFGGQNVAVVVTAT